MWATTCDEYQFTVIHIGKHFTIVQSQLSCVDINFYCFSLSLSLATWSDIDQMNSRILIEYIEHCWWWCTYYHFHCNLPQSVQSIVLTNRSGSGERGSNAVIIAIALTICIIMAILTSTWCISLVPISVNSLVSIDRLSLTANIIVVAVWVVVVVVIVNTSCIVNSHCLINDHSWLLINSMLAIY